MTTYSICRSLITSLSYIHVVANGKISLFYGWVVFHCVCVCITSSLPIHLLADGHLGYFQSCLCVNNAAMNTRAHGSFQISFFFFFFLWLQLHLWHMEVPRLGVELELQLRSMPQPQQHQTGAAPMTYVAACNNAGSLTHWGRQGIDPASSRTLCQVLNLLSHKGNAQISFCFLQMYTQEWNIW